MVVDVRDDPAASSSSTRSAHDGGGSIDSRETRSWSSYVARMPRRSRAVATLLTRCENFVVFCLCIVFRRAPLNGGLPTARTGDLRLLPDRDSQLRRQALAAELGSPARSLFGLDELRDRGYSVSHNLERTRSRSRVRARAAGGAMKRTVERAGGYGETSRPSSRR